jgi:tripartite-type tricarboxylate transporter receptor subunit TctC
MKRIALLLAACALSLSLPLAAQTFPSKPVRLIVPYAPGGSVDLLARVMRDGLQDALGQPVVVENRAGAGGAIGVEAAAKSPPDGHTLLLSGSGAITVNVHLTKLPYDPAKDLAPVSMLTTLPIVIAVHPSVPARSMGELVAYAKSRPGTLNYSSNGRGSVAFLAAELLKYMTGIRMEHVAYKGAAPATVAILAGEVQLGFVDSAAVMPQARAGAVRALAVTDAKRSVIVPDLPTVAESGVPGYEVSGWVGLFAPAGTPAPVIARLNADVARVLNNAEVRERILKAQMEPAPNTAEEFGRFISAESRQWATVIQSAGIKAE